ncbi:MAG: ATP-binding cassette domain-containing protein [Nocardioidaceae bacterium]
MPQTPESGVVASTVYDEAMATSRAVGLDEARSGRRADALLEALGLTHVRPASPYHLSGGEQRRLMVAAALVHGPQGIVLDEPTVGQDRATWAAVLGCVASAQSAGAAVALATHDVDAVTALAADQLRLEHGRALR